MKTRIILSLVGILSLTQIMAQDVRFTQPYSNPLRLNPALMGANYDMSFNLGYRSQWSTVDGGFNTGQFTYMLPVLLQDNGHKLDVGLNVMSDEQGAFTTFDGALAVGYTLKLSSTGHSLSASIMGGYVQNTLGVDDLTFDEQYQQGSYDKNNPNGELLLSEEASYIDAGAGLMWFYNPIEDSAKTLNAFAGISAYHVNNPTVSYMEGDATLPMRLTTLAGIKIYTSGKLDFTPQVRYDDQVGPGEFSTGLYTGYTVSETFRTVLGLWYRNSNAFAISLGLNWKDLTLGYSYDMPGAELSSGISNSTVNEVSLGYRLPWASKKGVSYSPSPFDPF